MLTATEYKEQFGLKTALIDQYSIVYFMVKDVLNINRCEKLLIANGFTVKRITERFRTQGLLYSLVYYGEQEVGVIDLQGCPKIEFNKRCRKFAKMIEASELVIAPIPTIHRILDWHTVKGKLHCLAGGETVCHVLPILVDATVMAEQIKILNLQPLVDHYNQKIKPTL